MDRRQQKTRAAIFQAFEHLLAHKNYNKITVKEIIDLANVGRTTFYDHFETKDALLYELCTNLFDHVFSDQPGAENTHDFSLSEGDARTIVSHILYHLKENEKHISKLMVGESSEIFLVYFKKYLDEMAMKYLIDEMLHNNSKVPKDFLKNHISGSFMNMVQWWIKNGMKEGPEELAEYFLAVIEPIL